MEKRGPIVSMNWVSYNRIRFIKNHLSPAAGVCKNRLSLVAGACKNRLSPAAGACSCDLFTSLGCDF